MEGGGRGCVWYLQNSGSNPSSGWKYTSQEECFLCINFWQKHLSLYTSGCCLNYKGGNKNKLLVTKLMTDTRQNLTACKLKNISMLSEVIWILLLLYCGKLVIKPPTNNSQNWNPRMLRDTICKKKEKKKITCSINSVLIL